MLADIAIENLGVIPRERVELSNGLTVLTGETGAGKTMFVTGLRLLIGGRADASRVRTGAENAVVEGRFVLTRTQEAVASHAEAIVAQAGGQPDENGEFIASRIVSSAGRSRAHLGGRAVPASILGDFTSELLTIHGQNDQLRLLSPDRQLAALDRVDPKILPLLEKYKKAYQQWRKLDRDLAKRTASRRELAQEVDRLQFAISEIDDIDPQPGEDEQLVSDIRRLQDVDELREQAVNALGAIDGTGGLTDFGFSGGSESEGASDLLGQASGFLRNSSDPHLKELQLRLDTVTAELSQIAAELGGFLSELPADPEALDSLLLRQQDLKNLTRKYAPSIDEVLEWSERAKAKLHSIDTSPEALNHLAQEVATAELSMKKAAVALTKARKKAASFLEKKVTEELHGLAMPKAVFSVALHDVVCGEVGADEIEFLLAPNTSADPRPLATSASGGELSRVMLALEVILSAGNHGSTLVFDEVDAGVGGRAAVEIGRRLARLAQNNQVIVVTHLPQVAAYADSHLHVSKDVSEESVSSGIELLTEDRRVEELARMLAGLDDTDTGRAHARELLDKAQEEVEKFRSHG
ncbi:DNA repair protein RecN [Corynebacterium mustelae]|nr:DNA repair protein RecN [Corynebacterium mustelae]